MVGGAVWLIQYWTWGAQAWGWGATSAIRLATYAYIIL